VTELDESKLIELLVLKYKAIADAKGKLEDIPSIYTQNIYWVSRALV
jgi:hypothetical protein